MVALEGMNYAEAYRQAYELSETIKPTTIYGDATRTAHLPNVMARINELLEMKDRENSVRALTRAARVIDTLEKIMDHGKTDASRIKAAELLGKTVGAFREERGNDDSGRSLEELEDRLERMLSKRAKRARTINNE